MDAVQQFAQSVGVPVPQKFVVGGASKVKKLFSTVSSLIFLRLTISREDGQVSDFNSPKKQDLHSLAWTTAAVDNERVIGAMPIVMDILNIHRVRLCMIQFLEEQTFFG